MLEIKLMTEAGLAAAAAGLSRAFMKDPLQNYTFPDEAERAAKSPAHFSAALKYGLMYGEVYSTPGGEATSIWLKPGATEISEEQAEKAGLSTLGEQIGHEAFGRFFTALGFCEEYHKRDMPDPHWYTMVLGVDPAFQGQGLGRACLQPVIEKAKRDKVPIYLETAQPSNVTFYKNIGFDIVRELKEPSSGLDVWTFRLDP